MSDASMLDETILNAKGISMRILGPVCGILCLALAIQSSSVVDGQEPKQQLSQKDQFDQFAQTMSNARLVGQFTMTGKDSGELTAEEYHVLEVRKLDEGDYWMFKARIKYGGRDVTVPMPLEVKWAAKTPVITLDEVEIPLLGKFSARVVIDGNKYAGTWSHGEVGGHLFGKIVPNQAEAKEPNEEKSDK